MGWVFHCCCCGFAEMLGRSRPLVGLGPFSAVAGLATHAAKQGLMCFFLLRVAHSPPSFECLRAVRRHSCLDRATFFHEYAVVGCYHVYPTLHDATWYVVVSSAVHTYMLDQWDLTKRKTPTRLSTTTSAGEERSATERGAREGGSTNRHVTPFGLPFF